MIRGEPRAAADAARTECGFCREFADAADSRGVVVFEDELFRVVHPIEPEGLSFVGLVQLYPRRHIRDLGALDGEEAGRLGPLLARVSRALTRCTGAEWTYCALYLEGFRHVHFLLTARYPGVPAEYLRLRISEWPGAPRGTSMEI